MNDIYTMNISLSSKVTMKRIVYLLIFILMTIPCVNSTEILEEKENARLDMIIHIINNNLNNVWNTFLVVGDVPDYFYSKIKLLPFTLAVQGAGEGYYINDVVKYSSNTVLIDCPIMSQLNVIIRKAIRSPYWHPHSNVVFYLHSEEDDITLAKLFYVFWYQRAPNFIIVQYDDEKELMIISVYDPYVTNKYDKKNIFGCWTVKKITIPVVDYEKGISCERECHSVTQHSKKRSNYLGTCIGVSTYEVPYGELGTLEKLNLFDDKGKNLHGYALRGHVVELLPFMRITEEADGTYKTYSRDGMVWTTLSELLNFTLDLSPSKDTMKAKYSYATNIQQLNEFSQRKVDLFVSPVYQLDLLFVDVDQCVPYKESGVCLLSHRADLETVLFNIKLLKKHSSILIQFVLCFLSIWSVFSIFNFMERRHFSLDQIGKDFMNTVRNILLINLFKPPKKQLFRIFLAVSLWSFFILNFAGQAAITSFFTAYKRGKEVDSFLDVIEKGYSIEGITSPDVILPDDEEVFRTINSMMVASGDLFECVNSLSEDKKRFCLMDCALGRYMERNRLNERGEQYLHILRNDRIHSHYLIWLQHKHSLLTKHINKYLLALVEAGIVRKWEQYRYNEIKEEVIVKALSMSDLVGVFECFCFLLFVSLVIFVLEVIVGFCKSIRKRECLENN